MNNPSPQEPTAQEEYRITFVNKAPENKEWTAHIKLLNEWTTPDRYLRDILKYNRSGEHFPTDMHVDLIEQWHEAEATRRERAADERLLDELDRMANMNLSYPVNVDRLDMFIAAKRQALKNK